ncbi:acetaldehyde dehydrogenase (acetylating), partial [Gammaproteobacteria bacterium]|nr:acetaldehyde dehydrogenase (acetylating) [Gammaproteobacteria bacterium]
MEKTNCAIIGSGNIGTDLMLKIANTSKSLNLIGVIGIDPESEGLAMASTMNIATSSTGLQGFMEMPEYSDTQIFFDAT